MNLIIKEINNFNSKTINSLSNKRKLNLAYNFCVGGYFTINTIKYDILICKKSASLLYTEVLKNGTKNLQEEARDDLGGVCKGIFFDALKLSRIMYSPIPFEMGEEL